VPAAELPRLVNLALGQNHILERIANGSPLRETLSALLLFIERDVPEMLCSVLLLDEDGRHLRLGAAPSLPDAYSKAIDGAAIGPQAGSCGTAAFLKKQVVVEDTEVDPLWVDYRDLARRHGLRACWSTPIFRDSRVIGTFAMYFREPRLPASAHYQLIAIATHVAAIAIGRDIREAVIRESEERYRYLAFHEPVTQLSNRTAMQRDLAAAVATAETEGSDLALLLLNLNFFRDINDSLGHDNGDLLLRRVAGRLRETVGHEGRVASLGGDEFAVLLPHLSAPSEYERALASVQKCLQRPFELAGVPVKLEATAGVAFYPRDGSTPQLVWQHADVALRTAKERREPYLCYDAGIDHYDAVRLSLIAELESAIKADQLVLYYQPKVDLRSGEAIGVEALVRWTHPTHGIVSPDAFIPLAERTELVNPLTRWIVATAMRDGLALSRASVPLGVAVNLSARSLHDADFCKDLLALVYEAAFPVARLTFEITETAIVSDPTRVRAGLDLFRAAGIHLAMDDFGVGQSSLTYLKDLPITEMKIDKSFVMDLSNAHNAAIVRSAIDLGRNLRLQVTAEGVEHESAYFALKAMGCDVGQGYLFGRPLPLEALVEWLRRSSWAH
jgi:diguanylate cyclase (GGDEF)-like protein